MTIHETHRQLRSHLYIPADNPAMLAKAAARGADALILDLEDAVADSRKLIAREAAVAFAREVDAGGPELWVRINEGSRGLQDLSHLSTAIGVTGVWIPKAEPGAWLDEALAALASAGKRVGLLIESAAGVSGLQSFPPLPATSLVQVGEADLAASLRIEGLEDQLLVYRSMVVLEWAARGLLAPIAPVSVSFNDIEEYLGQCERMRDWGFVGRACVHPTQVSAANAVWGVSEAELDCARELVREFEARKADGVGAFRGSDGTMVDKATVRRARAVLAANIR